MLGKLAIYSENGLIKGRDYVSVAEICHHTGRGAANITRYATEGHFGPAKQSGGVSVYSVELVNQCIINGMSRSQRAAANAGAVKFTK